MPIFEYRCKKCGITYEKIIFNRDAPQPACPNCGGEDVEKLISAPGRCGVADGAGSGASAASSKPSASCGAGFR